MAKAPIANYMVRYVGVDNVDKFHVYGNLDAACIINISRRIQMRLSALRELVPT